MAATVMAPALEGIRVLDLAAGIAGPYATALMVGLGAEVVKVERPGVGDLARRWGSFRGDRPSTGLGGLFLYLNGGKKGITLDADSATGRRLLTRLAGSFDIVFADEKPAPPYETLAEANPEVVYVRVRSFGGDGSYEAYSGAEIVYQALCGLAYLTGEPSREPLALGLPVVQYAAGQLAFGAALTAWYHRLQCGEGQEVEVSLLEAGATIMEHGPAIWSYRRKVRRRVGNTGGLAGWGLYPCKDGYVGVISGLGDAYEKFLDWVGLKDEKFRSWAARSIHADEMHAAIISFLADRGKKEVFEEGQAKGLPFGYVCDAADLMASRQLESREFFVAVEDGIGSVEAPGAPFVMSGGKWSTTAAPAAGQHNEEVLCGGLGLSGQDLGRLRQAGVV
jgi:crotonobetainyl-CoA:carnitine CoA-transferase CaiB-like acyl-CoA transferase